MSLTFPGDVRGQAFLELLVAMTALAARAGLVTSKYEDENPTPEAVALLTALRPREVARQETRHWPGSVVPEWAEPLVSLTFDYDTGVAQTLYQHCPELLGWQDRGLPYDLHLLDAEGSTVLGSITSEDDAWVQMSQSVWRESVAHSDLLRKLRMRNDG